jgi:hypothetical protein
MIYAGFQPGSNAVANVIVGAQPGDFVAGLVYHEVKDWSQGLPQVGWVRDPVTGRIAPPVAPASEEPKV